MSNSNKEDVGQEELSSKNSKPDIFDRIMSVKPFKILNPFYKKYKSVLLYLFFGGLTTVVSFITYLIPISLFTFASHSVIIVISNIISWICAVTFAFFTNRIWVFDAATDNKTDFFKQLISFFGGRLVTLIIETIILVSFSLILPSKNFVTKLIAQIVVLILNYVISKVFVFKKK